ncbi:hypothetical protein [uncultured Thiodictyon sp.]|uniref:hypothetical protein n=1 Tax=uncultured Thiodictyon sp. TaxID=1846217 RepID=UPI0025DE3D0F|nr:hypothetical protein [uncultured Thiodictyon sp.]
MDLAHRLLGLTQLPAGIGQLGGQPGAVLAAAGHLLLFGDQGLGKLAQFALDLLDLRLVATLVLTPLVFVRPPFQTALVSKAGGP